MDHSMAQGAGDVRVELPPWKTVVSTLCAGILGLLFIVAGVWKITDPYGASVRMTQALIPPSLSLSAAIALGISETFSGVLLLIPRFRRWGAWLTAALLVAFMIYIGVFYSRLQGEECNCFPWLKRAVGPGFFIGDAVMLLLAVGAGVWAKRPEPVRVAALIFGAVTVFALVSFGMAATRLTGIKAPDTISVDGKPFSLQQGRIFIYFFDPECSHCDQAARTMAKYNWKDIQIVAVPTRAPHFSQSFLQDTGLKAVVTTDLDLLRQTFKFGDAPYAVAIEKGRQKLALAHFDDQQPAQDLRESGFIE
jgi:uncharacterized membrane protein YphA (DoxX/SURF4 family)